MTKRPARKRTAETMIVRHSPGSWRITVGADKAYDTRDFVDDLRDLNVTPHIAQNTTNRSSAIDARTTRHPGYAISQQKRKRTEEPFGHRRARPAHAPRSRAIGIQVYSDNGRLRSHPATKAAPALA